MASSGDGVDVSAPVTTTPLVRSGIASIKKEYLLHQNAEEVPNVNPVTDVGPSEPAASKDAPNSTKDNNDAPKQRFRGSDNKRKQKMAHARSEAKQYEVRLCSSVLIPEKKCRYGEKCNFEHSVEAYAKLKKPDIGDRCVNFDAMGKCPFGISCRYAGVHTNEDYSQKVKDPDPAYKPTINSRSVDVQIKIRKHDYDFSKAEQACKKFTSPDAPNLGAMEREKLKLDMRTLKGKSYLAPLTTVGNLPFRRLCVELGAEITCGEMAVATNFLHQGAANEWPLLKRHPSEKIFGVQLAGGYPDTLGKTAQIVAENMDVDFIDLNLGCPLDLINEKGGGCALANRSNKLIPVVRTMQSVMGDIPLTLKMRYGMKYEEKTSHFVMKKLANEECPPQMITLHPRSRDQRYSKEADWDYVPTCIEALNGKIPFWVCGDVFSYEDYYNRLETTNIDGIMIGRGALIKPWIFTEIAERRHWDISATERLDIIRKFTNYGLEHWGSDNSGVEHTRRFLLEALSFQHRYIPIGLLEHMPPKMNEKPPAYFGRSDMETLLASKAASDWVKVTEMFLGPTPQGFLFVPKHKANAY